MKLTGIKKLRERDITERIILAIQKLLEKTDRIVLRAYKKERRAQGIATQSTLSQ